MDIPLIYPLDSHGAVALDVNKIDPTRSVLSASILHEENIDNAYVPTMQLVYDNIDYRNIPNLSLDNVTYMHTLTYSSTTGRTSKLYTEVLQTNTGILDPLVPLTFTYTPRALQLTPVPISDNAVLDINFYTAEANILQFTGVPIGGNNGPITSVYKYTYPFSATATPTSLGTDTHFDGWYTSTLVLFRNVTADMEAIKADVYAYSGEVGKATHAGVFGFTVTGELIITDSEGVEHQALDPLSYEEFILRSNNLIGINSNDTGVLANTQLLVTDELNNAIVNEVKNIACDPACDDTCTIADWQKLQQKRLGAYIYFTENDYRKAQVIMESARKTCNLNNKSC